MAVVLGQWQAGHLIPVWSPHLEFGYGSPLPALYHKTFMYLSAAVLGITGSAKAGMVFPLFTFMVVGFMGMCLCLRLALQGRHPWLWLAGAATFVSSNYLTTDWLVRGALAEVSAMAFIPLLLAWCLILIGQGRWPLWIGIVLPLLALSHSTLGLFGLLPLGIAAALAVQRWRGVARRWIVPGVQSVALTALLMIPFLLPMAAMGRFNRIEQLTHAPDFTPRTNAWPLARYLWDPDWTWNKGWTGYTVQLDLVPLLLLPVCVALVFRRARSKSSATGAMIEQRWSVAFLVAVLCAMGWLQTRSALWVYDVVPGTQYLQFAWRLLAYATPCLILCACIGLSRLALAGSGGRFSRGPALATAAAVLMVAWTASPKLGWHKLRYDWYQPVQFDEALRSPDYAAFGEFLPKVDWPESKGLADAAPDARRQLAALPASPCTVASEAVDVAPPHQRTRALWRAECGASSRLALPVFLAPGMQLQIRAVGERDWVDAVPARDCGDPRVHLQVPAGQTEVLLRFPNWWRTSREALMRRGFDFRRDCAGRPAPASAQVSAGRS